MLVPGAGRFALGPLHRGGGVDPHVGRAGPVRPARTPRRLDRARARAARRGPHWRRPHRRAACSSCRSCSSRGSRRTRWRPTKREKADFPDVGRAGARRRWTATAPAPRVDDPEACRALAELVTTWTTESERTSRSRGRRGRRTRRARRARTRPTPAWPRSMPPTHAVAAMAWAAASGGAHGRRRGMAPGRFAAWWTVAALAGLLDDWPLAPADARRRRPRGLRWYRWDAGAPDTGWALRLAVEDPDDGLRGRSAHGSACTRPPTRASVYPYRHYVESSGPGQIGPSTRSR